MDVTELLEQDHRKVESLFANYESGQSEDVLAQICNELEIHTTLEEELVYPRLAQLDRDLEQHAESEHEEAKLLIDQIRAGDPDVSTLARQLQMAVEAHVRGGGAGLPLAAGADGCRAADDRRRGGPPQGATHDGVVGSMSFAVGLISVRRGELHVRAAAAPEAQHHAGDDRDGSHDEQEPQRGMTNPRTSARMATTHRTAAFRVTFIADVMPTVAG